MSEGKLKIVRVLANPIKRRGTKKKKRKRVVKAAKRQTRYLIRLIKPRSNGMGYGAEWWTGKDFSTQLARAKKMPSAEARRAAKSAAVRAKTPSNAVVIDLFPA